MHSVKLINGSGSRLLGAQQVRALRIYLGATTFLYAVGVTLTLFPVRENPTLSNPIGGIIAICLGVAALIHLAVRPDRPLPATLAAIAATPMVMAFHQLITAEFSCLIGTMFLAMYLRAFYRPRPAWGLILVLTTACLIALAVAPAPKATTTYVLVPVAIIGAAESFGVVTRALVTAACTDPLTGLLNRAGWDIATGELISRNRSRPVTVTVVALDLDGFKQLNDTYGHLAGDEHLVHCARLWAHAAPSGAVLARLGGDEFAVCIVARDPGDAETFIGQVGQLTPDASVGSAAQPAESADLVELHAHADEALYAAKGRTLRDPQP
jgi:diguanylate cyclase (GGDEF)-like protein